MSVTRILLACSLALLLTPAAPASAQSLGEGCPSGASFTSVKCRLGSLLTFIQGSSAPVKDVKNISRLTMQTEGKVTAAEAASNAGKKKPARVRLGKAGRFLKKLADKLRALAAQSAFVPRAITLGDAATFVESIREDVTTLTAAVATGFQFGEICCVRLCLPPPDSDSGCSIVRTSPCTSADCLAALDSCAMAGCAVAVAVTPFTSCASLLPECTDSLTCPAENPTCIP